MNKYTYEINPEINIRGNKCMNINIGLAEHHQDQTQRLVMSMGSRLQAVIDCKGFETEY